MDCGGAAEIKRSHPAFPPRGVYAMVNMLDGAVTVQMIWPTTEKSFHDYVNTNIAGFVRSHMSYESVTRLDIVFETYPEENKLKTQTHQCRETGSKTKVIFQNVTGTVTSLKK